MSRPPSRPPANTPRTPRTPPRAGSAAFELSRARDAARESESAGVSPQGGALLRLAIGKDGLGIELAEPMRAACLSVTELVVRLSQVRFPFDVTGGVAKFRHKRGELERVSVELDARHVARWAEPRLRGLLSADAAAVTITPRAFGATVTVHAKRSVSEASAAPQVPVLAFEIGLSTGPVGASLVVHGARGAHLQEPPTTLAIRAVTALVAGAAARTGARFDLGDAAAKVARAILPDAGVRAPEATGVALAGSGESDGVLFVSFVAGGAPAKLPAEITLAMEAAALTRGGDDARAAGDLDAARLEDVAALERAPRHPEIARRIAEIDHAVGGRAEAARTAAREIAGHAHLGALLGDLLAESGDDTAAVAALLSAAEREPAAVVAAATYARAATFTRDPHDALAWLDAAIARAPRLAELRWERARRRLAVGRVDEARADFQDLEALAHGGRDRHDVLRRAADDHRAAGLDLQASLLYERALLYRPDDPSALAGLGVAIARQGRAARGAALLAHAIEATTARGEDAAWMLLELGRVLGEDLRDRPAAIARLRAVPDAAPEAIVARGLEGRFRALLGDDSGASLAFARLRERAGREAVALPWLDEAVRFEEERGELRAAQQHLAAAIAIAPRDDEREARYRAIGQRIAGRAPIVEAAPSAPRPSAPQVARPETTSPATAVIDDARDQPDDHEPDDHEPDDRAREDEDHDAWAKASSALAGALDDDGAEDDAELEARVEALTRTLQGDPTNDAVVDELSVLLKKLGRSMDLLALLSARLEDAPAERREALLPKHRAVLADLEAEARAQGRDVEADLFKLAREAS